MKQAVLNMMRAVGAFSPFRIANRGRALILTYHRFSASDTDESGATTARAFKAQLEYLTAHYRVVPLAEIAAQIGRGEKLEPARVAITIDDGFRDAHRVAFPLLRQFKAPATVFVITDFVDGKTWMWTDKLRFLTSRASAEEYEITIEKRALRFTLDGNHARRAAATRINEILKTLRDEAKEKAIERIARELRVELPQLPPEEFAPLSWDEVREMDRAGVETASHTLTHPILTNVNGDRLRRELQDSRARLEEMLGHKTEAFCYPNGNYDERVLDEVKRAGYSCAVTTERGLNDTGTDPLLLKRIPAENDLAHFVQSTSGFEEVKAHLRRGRGTRTQAVSGEPVY
jgi:peptidoglycan/xylan/chitin deacetylase (PgdA/CDA1 family)